MIYFIQFRSEVSAKLERDTLRRNFSGLDIIYLNALAESFSMPRLTSRDRVILGGSADLNLADASVNTIDTDIDDLVVQVGEIIDMCTATRTPVLGICFGHQLIASSLGGRVEKIPSMAEIGISAISHNGNTFYAVEGHNETVTKLPEGAKTLASSDVCKTQILDYGLGVYSVQFHPEISNMDVSARLAASKGYEFTNAGTDLSVSTEDSHKILTTFIEEGRV